MDAFDKINYIITFLEQQIINTYTITINKFAMIDQKIYEHDYKNCEYEYKINDLEQRILSLETKLRNNHVQHIETRDRLILLEKKLL